MAEIDAIRGEGEVALVLALARGAKVADAAREAGVSESTVQRRMRDPVFRRQVQDARGDLIERMVGILATASATAAVTPAIRMMSPRVTPRMLPKSAASKSRVKLRPREISATPKAKLAVVMMPIAASPPIRRRRAVASISSAERKPHNPAPR